MKGLYLLLIVTLLQNLSVLSVSYPAPKILETTILDTDPPTIQISWTKVVSDDVQKPVLGYKVKVWEVQFIKTKKTVFYNGSFQEVEEIKEKPLNVFPLYPYLYDGVEYDETVIDSADTTTTIVQNVKLNNTYVIRVQACTWNTQGPLSEPVRIKLEKGFSVKQYLQALLLLFL